MSADIAPAVPPHRREYREAVEILATFRHHLTNRTVVLKDLTRFGGRIEINCGLDVDDVVMLTLPGCRPMLAFVAWSSSHGAGLEFSDLLPEATLHDLVSQYRLGQSPARPSSPSSTSRRTAL